MNLTCQPAALFGGAEPRALAEESGALDGHAHEVSNRAQQAEVIFAKFVPVGAGDIEHAELSAMTVERNAGVVAQSVGAVHEFLQAAARDDIDVRRAVEVAGAVGIEAVAAPRHAMGILGERRGQIQRRTEVRFAVLFIQQPDPASVQPKQLRHLGERGAKHLVHIHGAIERLGDAVEDGELAVALCQLLRIGCGGA